MGLASRVETFLLRVVRISYARAGVSSAHIGSHNRIVIRQREGSNHIFFKRKHFKAARLRNITVDMPAIPISRIEIDTSVHTVPLHGRHRRIEIARDSLHFLCSQIHNECLGIKVIGYGMFTAILANASESRRTARHQKLLPVRRVRSTSQISIPGDQRICLQGGQSISKEKRGERASSDVRLGSAAQQFLAIRGNIIQIDVVTYRRSGARKVRRHIVFHEI